MISIADRVDLTGLKPETLLAILVVERVYDSFGEGLHLTSVNDGEHMPGSLHYVGFAFDCRLASRARSTITARCKDRLGSSFDVVQEATHLHVEYQPKEAK